MRDLSPSSMLRRTGFGLVAVATLLAAACGEDSDPDPAEIPVNVTEAPSGGTGVATTFPAYGGY